MAIAIGSAPAKEPMRITFKDAFGETIVKTSTLGGTIDDTHILQIATDLSVLTNAEFLSMTVNERVVTGLPASATDAVFPTVNNLAEITFSQVDPLNAAKTIYRSFLIPAAVNAIFNLDKTLNVGTPGTDTLPNQLARLIANLENYLVLVDHAGTVHTGGWTFEPSKSGLVTIPSA